MAVLRPLVLISGEYTELPPGDSIENLTVGVLEAGDGLYGGGNLSEAIEVGVDIAPAASGLIFDGTGDSAKLTDDGVALVLGENALNSANSSLINSEAALASGEASVIISNQAIASGAAAQEIIDTTANAQIVYFKADSAIVSGSTVGFNSSHNVEAIRTDRSQVSISGLSPAYPLGSGTWQTTTSEMIYNAATDRYVIMGGSSFVGSDIASQLAAWNGNSFTIFPPQLIDSNGKTTHAKIADNGEDRVVFTYLDNNNDLIARLARIDLALNNLVILNSVTLNTSTERNIAENTIAYNPDEDNFAIVYKDGNSNMKATTVTINEPNLIQGPTTTVGSVLSYLDLAYNNDEQKFILAYEYREVPYANAPAAQVLIPSGDSLSRGTVFPTILAQPFNNTLAYATDYITATYNSTQGNNVVTYRDQRRYNYMAVGVDISGVNAVAGEPLRIYNGPTDTQIATAYNPNGDYFGWGAKIKTSGVWSAFSINEALEINTDRVPSIWSAYTVVSGVSPQYVNPDVISVVYAEPDDQFVWFGKANMQGTKYLASSGILSVAKPVQTCLPRNEFKGNTFVGIAQQTVASGETVGVRTEGSIDFINSGLTPGVPQYLDLTTSGFTSGDSTKPPIWSGEWTDVGTGLNSSTLLFDKSLDAFNNGEGGLYAAGGGGY